ncbi:MAG TPA: sugar ABC transporter permease [Microbacteriaceae bacterium]|nr:sugar ABC transporter permease [Microbacteriaceae bacterium]
MSAGTLDRQDERLNIGSGFRGELRSAAKSVRQGDIGSLPVIAGLIVVAIVFQTLNPVFLSSQNLVNLALQSTAIGVMAIGVVLVLLLAQIDLSIGSVNGFAAAILAVTFVQWQWPMWLALLVPLAVGAAIGAIYGLLYIRFGVPSFVITLGGLMAFLGFQLWSLGLNGSINIPFDSFIVRFTQASFLPDVVAYVLVAAIAVGYGASALRSAHRRARQNLSSASATGIYLRGALILVGLGALTWYMNTTRGVPVMFVLFLVLVAATGYALKRTRWGRAIYAIGGNEEAARRAGIHVSRVYMSVFVLSSFLAALGGLLAAGRLASANPSSGGGTTNLEAIAAAVIGGTSLFGGRGTASSAILGILVIESITNGLTLLNMDTSIRYIITGAVLLVAVVIDAISRKSRAAHGRA